MNTKFLDLQNTTKWVSEADIRIIEKTLLVMKGAHSLLNKYKIIDASKVENPGWEKCSLKNSRSVRPPYKKFKLHGVTNSPEDARVSDN